MKSNISDRLKVIGNNWDNSVVKQVGSSNSQYTKLTTLRDNINTLGEDIQKDIEIYSASTILNNISNLISEIDDIDSGELNDWQNGRTGTYGRTPLSNLIPTIRDILEIETDKYKVIYGYNDVNDISGPISCIPPTIYEGFEGNMHNLDNIINTRDLLKEFSEDEQAILDKAINSEETNLKFMIENFKEDPEMAKQYIISFFASNDNFMTLMNKINEYNNESKSFLNQELSNLVKQINLRGIIRISLPLWYIF